MKPVLIFFLMLVIFVVILFVWLVPVEQVMGAITKTLNEVIISEGCC